MQTIFIVFGEGGYNIALGIVATDGELKRALGGIAVAGGVGTIRIEAR